MQEIPKIFYKTKGFPSFLTWRPDTNPRSSKKPKYLCPGLTWQGLEGDMVLSTTCPAVHRGWKGHGVVHDCPMQPDKGELQPIPKSPTGSSGGE